MTWKTRDGLSKKQLESYPNESPDARVKCVEGHSLIVHTNGPEATALARCAAGRAPLYELGGGVPSEDDQFARFMERARDLDKGAPRRPSVRFLEFVYPDVVSAQLAHRKTRIAINRLIRGIEAKNQKKAESKIPSTGMSWTIDPTGTIVTVRATDPMAEDVIQKNAGVRPRFRIANHSFQH